MLRELRNALACAAILAWIVPAQEFEVASINPASAPISAGTGTYRFRNDDVRFEASSLSLLSLITLAYRVDGRTVEGPAWMGREYFAVAAQLPEGSARAQIPAMLRKLLADRFNLLVHPDQKVKPVYLLVVDPAGLALTAGTGGAGGRSKGCTFAFGRITCRNWTFRDLAEYLSRPNALINVPPIAPYVMVEQRQIDRPVIDQTGLDGVFDIDLQWVPPVPGKPRNPSIKADSVFAALESLGLRLLPGEHSFDILAVDRVEHLSH